MQLFLLQLRWELHRLWRRPRTYLPFIAGLGGAILLCLLLRIPSARAAIARNFWQVHVHFDEAYSGLTVAAHLLGELMLAIGTLGLALVGADLVGREAEDGTLRMVQCRPVSRMRVFAQKLIVLAAYTAALTAFLALGSLACGLGFEGPGNLVMIVTREGILGGFHFWPGLARYALATGLLFGCIFIIPLLAFALSCFPMKPAAAMAVALGIFLADDVIRVMPGTQASAQAWAMTPRIRVWREAFNKRIRWQRIGHGYAVLLPLQGMVIAVSWWGFRRRVFSG
ncbi:MAG: ABC transporter permease [Chthoniobacteraceae bacterium]